MSINENAKQPPQRRGAGIRSGGGCFVSRSAPLGGRAARPARAFTLLEVLLAVVVFAIILLAMHGVFFGALRLQNKTVESMERAVPLQQTLSIIKRDLANIVPPGGTLFGEIQTAPTLTGQQDQSQGQSQSQSQSVNFTSQSQINPAYAAFNSASTKGVIVSPTFYSAVGIIDDTAPWAEVERVLYYLAEPTNNMVGRDLVRSTSRNLLPVVQDEPVDQRLLSGVQDVLFTFYDGYQWLQIWDSSTTTSNKVPQAVKVEIQLAADPSEVKAREPITLVVPILVQASTNQSAQTTGGAQ